MPPTQPFLDLRPERTQLSPSLCADVAMSILGLTIDYGPYGWLEGYDPQWTPNTTDAVGRRYCYGNQPQIALWNLVRLANALLPLVDDKAPLEQALALYGETHVSAWRSMLAQKVGLNALEGDADDALLNELFEILQAVETDMTLFFRLLANVSTDVAREPADDAAWVEPLRRAYYSEAALEPPHLARTADWLRRYAERVRRDFVAGDERIARMPLSACRMRSSAARSRYGPLCPNPDTEQ